jgi:hypothetical protein
VCTTRLKMYFAICQLITEPNWVRSMVTGGPHYCAHFKVQTEGRQFVCELGHWQVRKFVTLMIGK